MPASINPDLPDGVTMVQLDNTPIPEPERPNVLGHIVEQEPEYHGVAEDAPPGVLMGGISFVAEASVIKAADVEKQQEQDSQ